MQWLREEPNRFHREDYYQAQIAYQLALGRAKKPRDFSRRYSIKDFLISFTTEKNKSKDSEMKTLEEKSERSRSIWSSALNKLVRKVKNKEKK